MRDDVCKIIEFLVGAEQIVIGLFHILCEFRNHVLRLFAFGDIAKGDHCAHDYFIFLNRSCDIFNRKRASILPPEDFFRFLMHFSAFKGGINVAFLTRVGGNRQI